MNFLIVFNAIFQKILRNNVLWKVTSNFHLQNQMIAPYIQIYHAKPHV
jgi:hypothetical protein